MNELSKAIIRWQNKPKTGVLRLTLAGRNDEAIAAIKKLNRSEVADLEALTRWVSNRCNDRYDEILEAEGYPKP